MSPNSVSEEDMSYYLRFLDAAFVVLSLYLIKRWATRQPAPSPPGPRRLPIIGNMLDMPSSQEWLTFAKWGQQWGTLLLIVVRCVVA